MQNTLIYILVILTVFSTGCTRFEKTFYQTAPVQELILESYVMLNCLSVHKNADNPPVLNTDKNPRILQHNNHKQEPMLFIEKELKIKPIKLPHGYISLKNVIATESISIPHRGKTIRILRTSTMEPKVFYISKHQLINLPEESLLLIPGDYLQIISYPFISFCEHND